MSLEVWGDDGGADDMFTADRVDEMIAEAVEEDRHARRHRWVRSCAAGFAACYLWAGLMVGCGLATVVPATNALGVAYLTLIWPVWLAQPWTGYEPPIHSWFFTFNGK